MQGTTGGSRRATGSSERLRQAQSPFWVVLLLGLILALCQGCSGDSQSGQGETSKLLGPIPAVPRADVRVEVRGMRAGLAVADRMVDVVAARCMKRAGAAFSPLPRKMYEPKPIPHVYGLPLSQAQRDGYWQWIGTSSEGQRPGGPPTGGVDQKKITLALLGSDEGPKVAVEDVLVGGTVTFPATGCLAEGRKAIYQDLTLWANNDNFANNFVDTVLREARNSDDLVALNETWSQCMEGKGLPGLETPEAAISKAYQLLPKEPRRSDFGETIPIATADTQCQLESGYSRKRETVEDRYLSAGSVRFAERIAASRNMYRAGASRASELSS